MPWACLVGLLSLLVMLFWLVETTRPALRYIVSSKQKWTTATLVGMVHFCLPINPNIRPSLIHHGLQH